MPAPGGWFVHETASTRYVNAGRMRGAVRRVLRSGGFRMVHLNVVGWVALLVPAATLGVLAARLGRASATVGGAAGAVAAWALGLVVDTARWRASDIGFSCPDVPRTAIDRLVDELRAGGVDASVELELRDADADAEMFQIRTRMRFRSTVERRLAMLNTVGR